MAQYYVSIPSSGRQQDITYGSGAPTVASDSVVVTYDRTSELTLMDLRNGLRQIELFLTDHTFPPV